MKFLRNYVTLAIVSAVMATSIGSNLEAVECAPCAEECYESCSTASMLVPAIALGAVAIAAIVIVSTRDNHHHHHGHHSH